MTRMLSLLILSFCLSAWSAAQTGGQLTLEEALRIGRARSNTLQASQARARGAEARAAETGSALLPQVRVDASYRRLSSVPPFAVQLPFQIPGLGPGPIVISPTILDNYALHASVQQPLFTGSRLTGAADAADLQARAGELDVRSDEADLVANITTAYWMLYQARETRRAVDENAARLEGMERDARNLLKAGMATRNDLLRIQTQLSNARLGQIDAENDLQVAGMSLNMAMGRPVETPVDPVSVPAAVDPASVPAAPPAVASALRLRPDALAMQNRVESSRAAVTAARGGFWPQLFLSANYYYSKPNARYLPAVNQWKDSWDVGLVMQFDLWNWGATSAQAEQAAEALAANRALADQLGQSIALDVERSILGVRRAARKIDVARLGVQQAEENSRSMQDKFRAGLATTTELLDASVALLQARTSLTGAQVEQEIARVRLQRASGELR